MRARKLAAKAATLACALIVGLLFVSGSACAAVTHNLLSTFGSFSSVQGVAVDQSTGDVYVYDAGAGKVFKFDASGAPVNFSSTGTNAIEGVGGAGEAEDEIAVDNSAGSAKGDIYVANGSHVGIYGADGKSLGELTEEAGKPWGKPCGVAVDPSGSVYVGLYPEHVNKYTPAANPVVDADYVSSLWKLNSVCNVVVDSAGSLYADSWSEGPVTKYEALQFSLIETPASGSEVPGSGRSIAVDTATDPVTKTADDLYVGRYTEVAQFEPAGGLIGTFAGHDENSSYNLRAVAVNSETGRVYVADDEHSRMDIFGPTAIVPDIVTGAATSVTTTTARLHGTVNPDEIAVTECRFEYGHPEPPHGSVTWQSVPCDTNPGSGKAPVEVSANVTGLTPNTGYQYQLVASNANGTGYGQIESFTTLSPPIVERELSSSVSLSTATVNAKVNPMGYDTTYHFEYGATASYGASVPIPDTDIGTGGGTVSQPLSGLQEGVTYHYRVVASSINGTTDGQDATFTTLSTPPPAPSDTCPNAAYRAGGLSETLPDCRAYEMVSPLDKNGSDIGANGSFAVRSSLSGDRASFMANTGFADTVGSGTNGFTFYMGSRGAGSWFTHSVQPPASPAAYQVANGGTFPEAFSPDLGYALERGYALPGADPGTGELNLYREDTGNRALETITIPAGGPFECNCAEGTTGYSSDMSVVAFAARANMLPQATGEAHKLYAWEHGALHLAGILPDGSIPAGGSQGPGPEGSVSSDGSRILFVSPADGSSAPQLYMRKNGTSTVWVSRSWTSSPNPEPQGVEFQAASPDGSRVLFTSVTPLLNADPGGGGVGLYVYTDSGGAESEAHLSFIARVPAEGSEMVAGMSDDATHIYFATNRGEPMPGFSDGGMYLWDKGTLHFVAKMNRLERGRDNGVDVRVSADGRRMAFVREPGFLEEPELIKPSGGGDVGESQYIYRGTGWKALYLYDEGSEKVTCVSCPPSGAVMTGEVEVVPFIPGIAIGGGIPFPSRYLSSDGRFVFFTTAQALVPQDTNGLPDVYEYDADARQVKLLSSGTGESGSWFEDASADGSNVFFLTQQRLTGWDTDTLTDLYDVRAGGGFAEPPAPRVPCDGDACHGVPSAVPSFNTASGFTGLGNQPPVKQAATAKKKKAKPSKKHARGRHKKRRGRKAVRRVGMSAGRVSRRAGR